MAGFGGFAGLAAVPKGYDQGAQGYWATQGLEQDHAAMEALGRGLQLLAPQGAMPGAMQAPGQGTGPSPPMGGGPPPGMVNPGRVQGQPQNLTGPVIPPGGFGPQAAPMPGGQPLNPAGQVGNPAGQVGNPAGQVGNPAGQVGGLTAVAKDQSRVQQFQQPMTWQAVAQAVVKANPGAPAAVIAAAVTKAMPLMQADSQQQWRMIQAQLAEQRIQQQGDLGGRRIAATERGQDIGLERTRAQVGGAQTRVETQQAGAGARTDATIAGRAGEGEANRKSREGIATKRIEEGHKQFTTKEERLNKGLAIRREGLEERIRQFDTRSQAQAQQFAEKAEAARAKVEQARDDKARLAAVNEWDKTQRAYDSYMRNKINAATNLSGAEKTKVLADLDREFKQFLTEKEQLSAGQGISGQPQARQRAKNPQTGAEVEWDGKAWVPVGP